MSNSATHLHEQFLSGEQSATEIVQGTLDTIHERDGELNAFLSVLDERALRKARELDERKAKGGALGRLAGIPIALKDNIAMRGEKLTCASKSLENYVCPYDATVTELLEKEDAIIVGKTNMDEFAMGGSGIHSAFGDTKNPWDLTCSPGGSSSGSAVAVSSGMVPLALGTDTGGSIRQPAAMTGIVGMKPSYGRVSRYGLVAFGSSLDQVGPFARNVRDAAMAMEVLARACQRDSTSLQLDPENYSNRLGASLDGEVIGVPWKFIEKLSEEKKANFERSIQVFRDSGATIVNVDLSILKYGIAVYYIVATAEASTNLARYDGIRYGLRSSDAKSIEEIYEFSRHDGFGWEVKNRILLGTFALSGGFQSAYYGKAQKVRSLIVRAVREAFKACKVIALPTAPTTAFPLDGIANPLEEYLQDLYTVGANLAGCPAISVPSGFDAKGLPYGLQLMAPQAHEGDLLAFADAFCRVAGFCDRLPKAYGGER